MSSGMSMHNPADLCPSNPADSLTDTRKLCNDVGNGLHAMAQPLTVLRAAIEMLSLPPEATVDRARYVEIAAVQVRRACAVFSSVHDLVSARLEAPHCMRLDLRAVTAPLIDHQRLSIEPSGVAIALLPDAAWLPVWGDAERTELAFAAALRTAAQVSSRGDVIELRAAPLAGFMQLTLLNARCHSERLSSVDRLELSLAETNILSQYGKFTFAGDPFSVSLSWPLDENVLLSTDSGDSCTLPLRPN